MLDVENKVVAITGASSGIGEASAKLLAQNGAKVVLGARRTEKLEKIVEGIRSPGYERIHSLTLPKGNLIALMSSLTMQA